MVLEVVKHPDPRLKQKSQKAQANKNLEDLVQNMLDTINAFKNPEAAGVSAIQVGIPLRVLIARDIAPFDTSLHTTKPLTRDFIIINPKYVSRSREEELDWEGCLSFPNLYAKVWRAKKIKLKYQDIKGKEQRLTASGFLARVIQHEMDHMDGITFDTKTVGKLTRGENLEAGTKVTN